jgi:hypothetical protein
LYIGNIIEIRGRIFKDVLLSFTRQNYNFFPTYANIYDILGEKRGDFGEKIIKILDWIEDFKQKTTVLKM